MENLVYTGKECMEMENQAASLKNADRFQKDSQETLMEPGQEPRPYTFRKLNSADLFPMIQIISKIGIDELTQVFEGDYIKNLLETKESASENAGQEKNESYLLVGAGIALKVANKILEHIPSCEYEIYTLLASVSGMKVEEVRNLDLDIFMEMILEFIAKEEFASFFRVASRYISRLVN